MNLRKYINHNLPIIEFGDEIGLVYDILETYESLPIVQDGKYLGIITLNEISSISKNEKGEFTLDGHSLFKPQLLISQSPLEATKVLQNLVLDFIPVVDEEGNYLGVWDDESIKNFYLSSEALQNDGSAVVLEIEPRNYSLSEITQICEANNKRVLGIDLHTHAENDTLLVSIYIEEQNIGDLISAMERYGYNIINTIGYQENQEKLKENYDVLMSYLDI